MNFETKNLRETMLLLMALCGEISSSKAHAPALPGYSDRSCSDEIARMISERLIYYHRREGGERTLRISEPKGYEEIGRLSPALLDHAEIMAGKHRARYSGNKLYREKKRLSSELYFKLFSVGISVDGISIDNSFPLPSSLTDAGEILNASPHDMPLFITGPVMKKKQGLQEHTRQELSVSCGTLYSPSGPYQTYIARSSDFRWNSSSELQCAVYAKRLRGDNPDDLRLRAIICPSSLSAAEDIAANLSKKGRMNPLSMYRLCYMLPLCGQPELSMRLLSIPAWKEKADGIFGAGENGKTVNLLCCNLRRLNELKMSAPAERIITQDYMVPVVRSVLGSDTDIVPVSPEELSAIISYCEKI